MGDTLIWALKFELKMYELRKLEKPLAVVKFAAPVVVGGKATYAPSHSLRQVPIPQFSLSLSVIAINSSYRNCKE